MLPNIFLEQFLDGSMDRECLFVVVQVHEDIEYVFYQFMTRLTIQYCPS